MNLSSLICRKLLKLRFNYYYLKFSVWKSLTNTLSRWIFCPHIALFVLYIWSSCCRCLDINHKLTGVCFWPSYVDRSGFVSREVFWFLVVYYMSVCVLVSDLSSLVFFFVSFTLICVINFVKTLDCLEWFNFHSLCLIVCKLWCP